VPGFELHRLRAERGVRTTVFMIKISLVRRAKFFTVPKQGRRARSRPRPSTSRAGRLRSLIDLLGTIQAFEAFGVNLYLDQQSIDTATPAGRLMFQITGAFAEFERSMIRQRVRARLKRAVESGKQLGRPKIDPAIEKRIQAQLRAKKGMLAIARDLKVGTGTVQRIKRELEEPGPFDSAVA
jgi:DNA invertase Pin-like site-specific DNA recombinase